MMILCLCEGEPTSMRSVAAYAHYTYAQWAPQELQVTLKKESLKKGGGGNPCVCELLNSRRTLTLPYPKFVGLKQPSEACHSHCLLSFAFSFAFIFVYLCFAFCILCSSISLCTLSSASSCACQSSLTLPLSLVLSLSQSVIGAPSLSALGRAHFAHNNDSDDERFSLSLCSSFATFSSSPSSPSSFFCFSSSSVSARYTCTPRSRQVLFRFVSLRLASFSALLFALGFCSRPAKNFAIFSFSQRKYGARSGCESKRAHQLKENTQR